MAQVQWNLQLKRKALMKQHIRTVDAVLFCDNLSLAAPLWQDFITCSAIVTRLHHLQRHCDETSSLAAPLWRDFITCSAIVTGLLSLAPPLWRNIIFRMYKCFWFMDVHRGRDERSQSDTRLHEKHRTSRDEVVWRIIVSLWHISQILLPLSKSIRVQWF